MKIVRFADTNDNFFYGRLLTADDLAGEQTATRQRAEILDGDIADGFVPTGKIVEIETLLAPVEPPNILCIGLNYRRHADESKMAYPERPLLFLKATNTLADPGAEIVLPPQSGEVDYEAELAVVIGKTARDVSENDALDHVFGYACANDVSARDWQLRLDKQWARGKSFDGFCPIGPMIVTADEVPDPNALGIRLTLNGQLVQNSNTSDMIFGVREVVSYLSQGMTLYPGTVILTGTPEGVGMGKTPPVWLQPGDVTVVSVDGLGELTNRFVAAAEDKA